MLDCDICKRLWDYIALPISHRLAMSKNNDIAQCFGKIFPTFSHSHYREDKYANVVHLSLTTGGAIAIQNYSI